METKQKTAKMLAILVLALGLMVCPAKGTLTLPYAGSTSTSGNAFSITNTGSGNAIYGEAAGAGDVEDYGGYFTAAGRSSVGVYGEANYTGDDPSSVIGVYGYANYTGRAPSCPVETYGGYFVAEDEGRCATSPGPGPVGLRRVGTGIYARGRWRAAEFDGTVGIKGGMIIKDQTYDSLHVELGWPAGDCVAAFYGNVKIKTFGIGATTVMELGEGLDYAEGFDVSDKTDITPGSVLVIDPDNPGKLRLSGEPYDTKVSGIVAGAKGTGSGVRLGGEKFDCDVALAGRVYCNVDATEAAVEPGDLLTTSATPGYAMKAADYIRAQGAILGKSMEKLEKGKKGQILVLVTLQ